MTISVFDLFTIGIGPSSSHTVGPMRAANQFVVALRRRGHLDDLEAMRVDLFGSLAATGAGHGTMSAILLGLEGCQPETITTEHKERRLAEIAASGVTRIGGVIPVPLTERDIDLHPDIVLPTHPNGMTFTAAGPHGRVLATETYFSVGGGFIVTEQTSGNSGQHPCSVALPYVSAQELLDICDRLDVSISEAALRNETCCRTENEVRAALLHLRDVMVECEQRSIAREGLLPGGLRVRRRAKVWYDRLNAEDPTRKPEFAEDWVNLVALAVNEENASGGRVVTAPTNGAAGIVPAVLHYAIHYTSAGAGDPDDVTVRFLLTAGAIGSLFKERASISGAEVGCQGEVGSAAAMAAAGLAEILGGTPRQVENAAEIAMEHSLGLTCDPIAGLVQIPCIERNAISAGKAINAARMALRGDGIHRVTLDQVIDTMRATGADMHTKYKETSAGGLAINVAVNIVECCPTVAVESGSSDGIDDPGELFGHSPQAALQLLVVRLGAGGHHLRVAPYFTEAIGSEVLAAAHRGIGGGTQCRQGPQFGVLHQRRQYGRHRDERPWHVADQFGVGHSRVRRDRDGGSARC